MGGREQRRTWWCVAVIVAAGICGYQLIPATTATADEITPSRVVLVQNGGSLVVAVAPITGLVHVPEDGSGTTTLHRGDMVTSGAISNFSPHAAILFSNQSDATVLRGGDVAVIIFGGDGDEDDEDDEDEEETAPLDQFFPPLWSPHALRQFWIYVPIIRF